MSESQLREKLHGADTNTEQWDALRYIKDDNERECKLLETLFSATRNAVRWGVYEMSSYTSTQEAALALIVIHAKSIEEILNVTQYASETLLEYIDVKIDLFDISVLRDPCSTNKDRWCVVHRTPYELLRKRALGEILDHEPTYADLIGIRAHPNATMEMKRKAFSLMCLLPPS